MLRVRVVKTIHAFTAQYCIHAFTTRQRTVLHSRIHRTAPHSPQGNAFTHSPYSTAFTHSPHSTAFTHSPHSTAFTHSPHRTAFTHSPHSTAFTHSQHGNARGAFVDGPVEGERKGGLGRIAAVTHCRCGEVCAEPRDARAGWWSCRRHRLPLKGGRGNTSRRSLATAHCWRPHQHPSASQPAGQPASQPASQASPSVEQQASRAERGRRDTA